MKVNFGKLLRKFHWAEVNVSKFKKISFTYVIYVSK